MGREDLAEKLAVAAEIRPYQAGTAVQVRNVNPIKQDLIGRGSKMVGGGGGSVVGGSMAPIEGGSVVGGTVVGYNNSKDSVRAAAKTLSSKISTRGLRIPDSSSHTVPSSSGHTVQSNGGSVVGKGSGHGSVTGRSIAGASVITKNTSSVNRGLRRTASEQEAKRAKRTPSQPGVVSETVINPAMDEKLASINLTAHPEDHRASLNPPDVEGGNLPYPTPQQEQANGGGGGDGLAVAKPLMGSSRRFGLVEAKEVDPNQAKELTPEQEKTKAFKRNGLIALVILAVVVTLAVVFTIDTNEEEPPEVTPVPTMAPTTAAPTMSPTTLLNFSLPEITEQAMVNDPLSPQARAYDWLSEHPFAYSLPSWRRKQLFALVSFYFALAGPDWPDIVQRSWLDPQIHECYWFSREFIDGEKEYYLGEAVGTNTVNVSICTEDGHYTTLGLSLLDMKEDQESVVLPPEIGWLSHLESLRLDISNVDANLSDLMLSQENGLIIPSNVSTLSFFYNRIHGSIPTQIAQMQPLTYLDISTNKLTGTIPSVIGTMTNLGEIYLQSNTIDGSLPTEFGNLGGVHRMDLSSNALTSTIPTEINAMTSLEWLWIRHNNLDGTLAGSDLGALTNLIGLYLQNNSFTGSLDKLITPEWAATHSQLMRYLHLASNDFGSTIPTEVGLMTNLKQLNLSDAGLTGTIPSELGLLNATNNQISLLGNNFEGELPIELCPWACMDVTSPFTIQEFLETSLLVASDQCNCTVGTTYPMDNVTNELVINVRFDEYPDETEWVFEKLVITPTLGMDVLMDNNTTAWASVDTQLGVSSQICELVSYKHQVTSNTLYHFYVMDAFGDGNCCNHGRGGVSITNGTIAFDETDEEYNPYKGTIVWNSWDAGFTDFAEAYVWVDAKGQTSIVSEQEGFDLAKEAAMDTNTTTLVVLSADQDNADQDNGNGA